jgi:hypothetical protein
MKNQLTSQMHDYNLLSFLMQKESWSTQILDAIDWNASDRALRRLSKNRQMNVLNLFIIIDIPVQDMLGFMEENAHAVSVKKPKRTGDTS